MLARTFPLLALGLALAWLAARPADAGPPVARAFAVPGPDLSLAPEAGDPPDVDRPPEDAAQTSAPLDPAAKGSRGGRGGDRVVSLRAESGPGLTPASERALLRARLAAPRPPSSTRGPTSTRGPPR